MICIETSQIGPEGYTISGEEPGATLDLAHDPIAHDAGPIHYTLTVTRAGTELVVRGEVSAPLSLQCRRCAKFFSTTVRIPAFLRAYEWAEHRERLDVTADVREEILLEIPGFPLCAESCQGLCPRCGQDWNERRCRCRPAEETTSPWEALKTWRGPDGSAPATE